MKNIKQEVNGLIKNRIQSDVDLQTIKTLLNFLDKEYYVQSKQVVTDFEYDQLFDLLKDFEQENPNKITPDSPTQRVARGLSEDFPTVAHLLPMRSLDKAYSHETLMSFEKRVKELTAQENVQFCIEPKFDGSSIALVYENDVLVRAATRGDGIEGDDITNNAKTIRTIPLKADFSKYGIFRVELRGEVVIELSNFERLNERRTEKNIELEKKGKKQLELFKNPRNTASGGLRTKDSKETANRFLEAFIYQIGLAEDENGNNLLGSAVKTQFEAMSVLDELGFKTPKETKAEYDSIEKVIEHCNYWNEERNRYNYEIDGMVIKVNDFLLQDRIGSTGHHPRWAVAFKFKAKQAETILERIEYQVGRTGAITPVAKVKPVQLAGVTVSSVSLHNEEFILEKDLHFGDTVVVERAGEVIPYIAGVILEKRTGNETKIEFPKTCPSCESTLVKPEGESIWRCDAVECSAQFEERMIHFVSKGSMNIDGLGKDIVKRFVEEKLIQKVSDIYQLDYEKILALEGWKERSVEKLKKNVEQSKKNPLWRLIVALGIRHVGSTTGKMLEKQVNHLLEYKNWTAEQFVELEDIGPKVAESLIHFFSNEKSLTILQNLEQLGINMTFEKAEMKSAVLEGKTFLFTGTLTQFTRTQAKTMVEENGGKTVSSVGKKLSFLVVGENPGSKFTKAQAIETITIIGENDFLEMIG